MLRSPGRPQVPSKGSVAIAIASLALVLQLGHMGLPSYAAGLITGKDIKNGSVTGKDIKDGSLRATDINPGELPSGVPGPPGPSGAPGSTGPSGPAGPTIVDHVAVLANSFSPQVITVPVGTTVTWFWSSGNHSLVSDDGVQFAFAPAVGPQVRMHRFDTVGTFVYHCVGHGGPGGTGQSGTVIVTAG